MARLVQHTLCGFLIAVLASCDGSSSAPGSPTTPTTTTTTPAITSYTVSTSAGEGTSFFPATVSVEPGKTASLTVTLQSGYFERVQQYAEGIGTGVTYDNSKEYGLLGICGIANNSLQSAFLRTH